MNKKYAVIYIVAAVFLMCLAGSASAQLDMEKLKDIKARSIGPAGMSGRVAAIDAVVSNPNIFYVGAATGGVWRTVNGGVTFEPIFDDQPVSSIGAVAIFQKNPAIVWIGTGEGNPRNSSGVGNGVYKSIDGGHTWRHIGLENTEKISRIRLHPDNQNIAYAAALGTTWGENPERGVFKTIDGGETWEKILFIDEKTGCADLEMDPANPNKLYAAMWEHRRWPWFFNSGGPGSGLHISYDGGKNWKKITDKEGLPEGDLGRIGIAASKSDPNIVYALMEAKKSVLCKSVDGGRTWKTVNTQANVNPRPFYYCDIRVDPENENRIYRLASSLSVSDDGGRTFSNMTPSTQLYPGYKVHTDHHALWINPVDSDYMINGNDGGVAISRDHGKTWNVVENLPLAQYYHIDIDMEIPYNVYGGLQDNDAWIGPADVWEEGGIRNCHWRVLVIGDGFFTMQDPDNPNGGFTTTQGGNLVRYNNNVGEYRSITPDPPAGTKLRFNWNAAFASDPFDKNTIYYGSQFVHKSTNKGETWKIISPDLTTNDPEKQKQIESGGITKDVTAAENHTSIITIAPSMLERGVIWAGTDDGNVQLTRDGGSTWINLTEKIDKKLPDATWCPQIEVSKHDPGTAYAVFDDHRRNNWKTYIYKTDNYGKSWKNLTKDNPAKDTNGNLIGFVHVIEEDPVNPDLLYAGTEFGLFVSLNGGKDWTKWINGMPTAPVRDLVVHPREHDLVIATHGRSVYVIDDIRPLREMSEDNLKKPVYLFETPVSYLHREKRPRETYFPGDQSFIGQPRTNGALLTYYMNIEEKGDDSKEKTKQNVIIEISTEDGIIIRRFKGTGKDGINRVAWDYRMDGQPRPGAKPDPDGLVPGGLEVIPGTYQVTVKYDEQSTSQPLLVNADPKETINHADRKEKFDALKNVQEKMNIVNEAVRRITKTTEAIDRILEITKDSKDESIKTLRKSGADIKKELTKVSGKFASPRGARRFSGGDNVSSDFRTASRKLGSSYDAPSLTDMEFVKQAEEKLDAALELFNKLFEETVPEFGSTVKQANIKLFPEFESLDINWKKK